MKMPSFKAPVLQKLDDLQAERLTIKNRLSQNQEDLNPEERSKMAIRLKEINKTLNQWYIHKTGL